MIWRMSSSCNDIQPIAVLDKELKGNVKTINYSREHEREKNKWILFSADSSVLLALCYISFFFIGYHKLLIHPHNCFLKIFLLRHTNLLWIWTSCYSSWLAYVIEFCYALLYVFLTSIVYCFQRTLPLIPLTGNLFKNLATSTNPKVQLQIVALLVY